LDSTAPDGRNAAAISNLTSSLTANQRLILAIIDHGVSECQNVRVMWEKLSALKDDESGEEFQVAVAELLARGHITISPAGRLKVAGGGRPLDVSPRE